jgi:hypothetical protein
MYSVAEVIIRAQQPTSTTPKYQVSQSIRPILAWACRLHTNLAGLRLRLIIILKLESLRRSDDLFNILRSSITFCDRGVTFRVFQPKEIKATLGIFGPPVFIPKNRQHPQCRSSSLLKEYINATATDLTVLLPTGRNILLKEEQRLFVSFSCITANTIASLGSKLLAILLLDGTSHVLRDMAASHMFKAGASKEAITAHMNTSPSNFSKFYFRPPTETLFHVRAIDF